MYLNALGGPLEDLARGIAKVQPAFETGVAVVQDPYLPEMACEGKRLQNVKAGRQPGPNCPRTPRVAAGTGVGLRHAVGPLRLYVRHKQHPWVAPTAIAGVLLLMFGLGYAAGKKG